MLAEHFLVKYSTQMEKAVTGVSRPAMDLLLRHDWPGNIRELSHELERALVFEEGPELLFEHLAGGRGSAAEPAPPGDAPPSSQEWFNPGFRFPETGFSLEEAIMRLIQHALHQTRGNVSAAGRLLGVSRDYLRYRLGGTKEGGDSAGAGGE